MDTSELDYDLPEDLIAQRPSEKRDASRLLVLDRADRSIREDTFANVAAYLRRGDCMVLNDTRVIRARLRGRKPTGGQVEVFLLRQTSPGTWDALVRPSARVQPGTQVEFRSGLSVRVGDRLPEGRRQVMVAPADEAALLEEIGEVPLPPYIRREVPDADDLVRYQTIYAREPGAVAAPTAGLHFTDDVFAALDDVGVRRTYLTLHVGYGTFRPIQSERVEDHVLEAEPFTLSAETATVLNQTRAEGGRIVAVGTTATRVLETQYRDGAVLPGSGFTKHYIYPPYDFQAVDLLQTNFHLPRSSLLALVCAFAGTEFVLDAYRYAIEHRFRFYSYGDAMLVL